MVYGQIEFNGVLYNGALFANDHVDDSKRDSHFPISCSGPLGLRTIVPTV